MENKILPYVTFISNQPPKTLTLVPSDPSSRYKTKQLQIQVVGKSKMIKTVLVNILDIAKYMQVPPSYIGSYMAYEIGAKAKFDPKKPERQQAFLSGEHDVNDLSLIMKQFINEIVLCPNCNLPEILIEVKDKDVFGNCRACGAHSPLPISNERFKKYIINHPPENQGSVFNGNKAGSKKNNEKGKNKISKTMKKSGSSSDDDDNDNDDNKNDKVNIEKEKKVIWYSDTSEEAARKRREEMLPENKIFQESNNNISETKTLNPSEAIKKVLENPSEEIIISELQKIKNTTVDDEIFFKALFTLLFPNNCDILETIDKKKNILSKFVIDNKCSQFLLLDCIENYCLNNKSILSKASIIVKKFYDFDLLEEEFILEWNKKESKNSNNIKNYLAPLIEWFKKAEIESNDDDDE